MCIHLANNEVFKVHIHVYKIYSVVFVCQFAEVIEYVKLCIHITGQHRSSAMKKVVGL